MRLLRILESILLSKLSLTMQVHIRQEEYFNVDFFNEGTRRSQVVKKIIKNVSIKFIL